MPRVCRQIRRYPPARVQALGILGRWEDPYLTMSAEYEAVIAQAFVDFLAQGYVYKGLKPVHWCIKDRTALAEAEVEYENHSSPSIYVRFTLTSDPAAIDPALAGREVYGLIWTTTPWTIPANLAIAFQSEIRIRRGRYAGRRSTSWPTDCSKGIAKHSVGTRRFWRDFPASKLERAVFRHPFLDRDSLGILGDHVTLEQGTGAVHTAPGHGQEDFVVGQRYGLPVYCPVDARRPVLSRPKARPAQLPEELLGKTVWEANPMVIELLKQHGALAGAAQGRTQLSALLALPQPDHFPRDRAVVHRHGPRRSCEPKRWKRSST